MPSGKSLSGRGLLTCGDGQGLSRQSDTVTWLNNNLRILKISHGRAITITAKPGHNNITLNWAYFSFTTIEMMSGIITLSSRELPLPPFTIWALFVLLARNPVKTCIVPSEKYSDTHAGCPAR